MKKYLLLTAALALMGQGCLSLNQQAETSVETTPSDAMMEDDSSMEDSMEGDDSMMEEGDDSMMEGMIKLDGSVTLEADATGSADIVNFTYQPSTIRVKQGGKVMFTNSDLEAHTVTATEGQFDSGLMRTDGTFTLDTSTLAPGEYPYYCTLHPNMRGTIIVE